MSNGGTLAQSEAVQSADEERIREIGEMLAYRERQLVQKALESLEGPSLEAPMAPEDARSFISDKAYDMIVRYETGGRAYYEKVYKSAPCWPGYSSGVTIGFGYDLGYVSKNEFVAVWGKILPAHDVERLKEACGLTSGRAQTVAGRLKDIRISWEVAETVFAQDTVPKFVSLTKAGLQNFDLEQLHPHSTGALVSLVFNRGSDFKSSSDKRLEMRKIRAYMEDRLFKQVPEEFRDMKRHWTSKGLKDRRDEEAALFEKGLELFRNQIIVKQPTPVPRPDPVPRPGDPPVASTAPSVPQAPLAQAPTPQMPTQAPAIGDGAPSGQIVASPAQGIPLPPEMGALESMYGAVDKSPKVSLEDDWLEYDQLPLDQIERPSSLESTRPSYTVAQVSWAGEDNELPDYRHAAGLASDGAFDLTADDLDTIIKVNRYRPVIGDHGKILFGLRGCTLVGETDKQVNKDALKLKLARPNHRNFRCTIGVFDTKTRKLSGFIASTVPNRTYVYTCWRNARDGEDLAGNMLPTGCYGYIVGQHNSTPSAFVLRKTIDVRRTVAVWRSTDDVTYTVQDSLDVCAPGDNIHPAYSASQADFSSAGCQVIRGNSTGGHNGEWALFRIAAGLPKDGNGKYGTPYSYILTSGLEAKAAAEMRVRGELADEKQVLQKLVRLRQGSHGDEVKALQNALGLEPTGEFDAAVAEKLAIWQREKLGFNDSIYSIDYDPHLNANILGAPPPPPVSVAQPAPIGRPDPVARPDAGTVAAPAALPASGDGQTAAGWGLESVGGGARRLAGTAYRSPARSRALESASARGQIESLLSEDETQLVRRLGLITEQVRTDPRRAGQLELATQPPPVQEGLLDAMSEIGGRVYSRLEPELFRLVCGASLGPTDDRDRAEIRVALAKLTTPTETNKAEVVSVVATALMGSGIAWYGIALVVAAIFVRRFAMTTLEETCRVWAAKRRLGSRPGESEVA